MSTVIVIAGTGDGRQLVERLLDKNLKVVATVTTEYGKQLMDECDGLTVLEGGLTSQDMIELIKKVSPVCLVDASHPYALNASVNAIQACERTCIHYMRFERPEALTGASSIIRVDSFEEGAKEAAKHHGNIFLTIGSNNLEVFVKTIGDTGRIYARVLPTVQVLAKCEALGLNPGNIIAVQGPFSEGMNIELLRHCKASVMVTKDSGEPGGTGEKLEAASKLGIPVIVIGRPCISYPSVRKSIDEVVIEVEKLIQAKA